MGKYMRKAKITGEVAVMELSQAPLGVRTRAKTLALQRLQTTSTSASYLQLRSRRLEKPQAVPESKKTREICEETPKTAPRLFAESANSGSVGSVSLSCSKKNEDACAAAAELEGSVELVEAGIEASFGENVLETDGRERSTRETTPCSLMRDSETLGTPGSTTRPTSSTATNRRTNAQRNIPTTHEMEEFFAIAEKQQQWIFTEKYNFDPVNDRPLPGRYEWVSLSQ